MIKTKSKLISSFSLFLLIGGCQTAFNLTKSPSEFQSLIACEQSVVILSDKSATVNSNPSKKYKRSECPECKGTGFIVSGDGLFKQNCPYCEPDSSEIAGNCGCENCGCVDCKCKKGENCQCNNGKECADRNVNNTKAVGGKCCQDCVCDSKKGCNCTYPGECLIKRNGGKAVKICDEKSCRQYASRSSTVAPNANKTITQPKPQTKNKPRYIYSNGCTTSG